MIIGLLSLANITQDEEQKNIYTKKSSVPDGFTDKL
jgi:hypothetical protein